jgi:hypothetical protein
MPKEKKTIKPVYKPGIKSDEIKDPSNAPFIIKKNEMAKKRLTGLVFRKNF